MEFNLFDSKFINPIGLAAGFDKNAEAIKGEFDLGFGFVELGTVTPINRLETPNPEFLKFQNIKLLSRDWVLITKVLKDF